MELQKFLSESLKQIIDGTVEAQEYASTKSAFVNPEKLHAGTGTIGSYNLPSLGRLIDFDIAITVSEQDGKSGGGSISIASFKLGGDISNSTNNSTITRLKFSIPLFLPEQKTKNGQ